VECQGVNRLSKAADLLVARQAGGGETLGERKSLRAYRSLLKSIPKHPPQDQYLVCRI